MTDTFAVGDKVTSLGEARGEITYGPFSSTFDRYAMYVVRFENGTEKSYRDSDLKAAPVFSVGDTVDYEYGAGGKLVAGPFKSAYHDVPFWVVETADGTHLSPTQNALTLTARVDDDQIRVGDRVRVLTDRANNASVVAGDVFTVASLVTYTTPGLRTVALPGRREGWFFSLTNVAKVTGSTMFAHEGVVYDLTAEYRDAVGDIWQFSGDVISGPTTQDEENDGTPVAQWRHPEGTWGGWYWSLGEAARNHGPLTRG